MKKDKGVCFAKKDGAKAAAAYDELNKYFFRVAINVADECEERAVAEWASQNGLEYEVREIKTISGGRAYGKLLNIYSYSQQEADANKRKLATEAPRGQTCDRQK